MFTTSNKKRDGFELVELRDQAGKSFAEIVPSCGGILHSFNCLHNGNFYNVIDSYANQQDFAQHVTANGFKSCKLSPFACRIKDARYSFEGVAYAPQKFLLGKNAIHGLLYDVPFTVLRQYADDDGASVVLQHQYRGTENGYPFWYDCIVTYQLKPHNELRLHTEIINKHSSSIPMQDGWHPYFTLGKKIDLLELTMRSKEQVVFDKDILPTGEYIPYTEFAEGKLIGSTFFDDCFLLDMPADQPLCVLKDRDLGIQVAIKPDSTYPYLQLYTPPHRNSIAIENLSAPPDAFNSGIELAVLAPGETANFATSYIVTSLK
jgi:aldose 1-epimerase